MTFNPENTPYHQEADHQRKTWNKFKARMKDVDLKLLTEKKVRKAGLKAGSGVTSATTSTRGRDACWTKYMGKVLYPMGPFSESIALPSAYS